MKIFQVEAEVASLETGFRMRKKSLNMVVAGAAVIAAFSLSSGSASASDYYSTMQNAKSKRCLSIADGGSTANGANAIIYDCNGSAEQYWDYRGTSEIVNSKSGKCLSTASGGGTDNGTEVIQWTCNGGAEQQWGITLSGEYINTKSGKCLSTASGGGVDNNTRVIIWSCNGASEQIWY
ncbi:RICIN domain-containing protein [Streptomyces murinus]